MKLVHVEQPEVLEPLSASCPDHWMNVIIYGKCWKNHDIKKSNEF